jgi:tetratricopeptide (TPR) repeat protein
VNRAKTLHNAGVFALMQTDYAAAGPLLEEALALSRSFDDAERVAYTLCALAALAVEHARYAEAEVVLQEALAIGRRRDDRVVIASALQNLGVCKTFGGEFDAARALYEECVAIARDTGDERMLAMSLKLLGNAEWRQGLLASASEHETESLDIVVKLGDGVQIAEVLANFAAIARARSQFRRAVRLWAFGERLRDDIGSPVIPRDLATYDQVKAQARAALGADAFALAWREGGEMALDDAVRCALVSSDD